jgi:hypothetical protein
MAATRGTQRSYVAGCRCKDCKEAHRAAARDYRERRANGPTPASVVTIPSAVVSEPAGPGPVESGVQAEISGLAAAELRPGVVAAALALARVLDNPRVASVHPPAVKVLVMVLDTLHKGSARPSRWFGIGADDEW